MIPLDVELIGLSGYADCGKDTVAGILAEYGWRRASFADQLRAALYALNPIADPWRQVTVRDLVDADGWDRAKRDTPHIRELLQRLGTEVGRDLFGENFWVDQAFAALPADHTRFVFTDVRFPSEYEAIKSRGGRVWRIDRPGFEPVNAHPSETALDHDYAFAANIFNGGSLADLHDAVVVSLAVNG